MKKLLMIVSLSLIGSVYANPGLGESNPKECECETCLIKHGVCVRTQGQQNRAPKSFENVSRKNTKAKQKAVRQ